MADLPPLKAYGQSFLCPHCGVLAGQKWLTYNLQEGNDAARGRCDHCHDMTFWYQRVMIYPDASGVAPPNPDLRDDRQADYQEAASIVQKSPRGAAAILRLCIQKLCGELGEKGKKIDDDIAALVKKGLPLTIQQSLDIVRVIGNNAVHPGQIDLKDDQDTAMKLFTLINLIARIMITQPKEIAALYSSLPQKSLDAIQRRDGTTTPPTSGSNTP